MASIIKADIWQNGVGITNQTPVQIKAVNGGTFDSSAASFQTVVSTTFTPRFANSLVLVTLTGHAYMYHSGYTSNPFRLVYGASTILSNNYYVYNSVEYMYHAAYRGFVTAPGITTQTVSFDINPNSTRCYMYGGTMVLTVEEFMQ
jgi:hypothetical protein